MTPVRAPHRTRGPALALRAAKQAIDSGLDVDLDTGLQLERLRIEVCPEQKPAEAQPSGAGEPSATPGLEAPAAATPAGPAPR